LALAGSNRPIGQTPSSAFDGQLVEWTAKSFRLANGTVHKDSIELVAYCDASGR